MDDADAAEDADVPLASARRSRLLWGGWRDDAGPPRRAGARRCPVSAMGGTTADHTSGDAADHASAPAPAPAARRPLRRAGSANALLNRCGPPSREGAARSLVASAALTSALRNLDPRRLCSAGSSRTSPRGGGSAAARLPTFLTLRSRSRSAVEHLYERRASRAFRRRSARRATPRALAELFLARPARRACRSTRTTRTTARRARCWSVSTSPRWKASPPPSSRRTSAPRSTPGSRA